MSLAAPTQFAIATGTGITAFNMAVVWSSNPAGSTITINGVTTPMLAVYDTPLSIVANIAAAGSCNSEVAEELLRYLQFIVYMYQNVSTSNPNVGLLGLTIS